MGVRNLFRGRRRSQGQGDDIISPAIKVVRAGCGHETAAEGEIAALGETTMMTMPRNAAGGFDYCLDCIAKMTIRCAWCDDIIFIGSPVTLYILPADEAVPDHAVVYSTDPLRLVGCLGWDCADTSVDRAGFWLPGESGQGAVHRIGTVFDMMLGDPGIASVIIRDLTDPHETPTITHYPV